MNQQKTFDAKNFTVISGQADEKELLGKFVYFSLGNVLAEKDEVEDICKNLGVSYNGRRISEVDAYRNATGSINDRKVMMVGDQRQIVKIYCRDNHHEGTLYSRELVRETLDTQTNHYEKLANFCYDRATDLFTIRDVAMYDSYVSEYEIYEYFHKAEQLFEVYRHCLGRSQIDTIVQHQLDAMDALPISVHGKLFFVPRHTMHLVDPFEDLIEALNGVNQHSAELIVNSFYVVDDAKQRQKMTAEFYNLVRKEVQTYQERAENLINNGCQSAAVMNRLIVRIDNLHDKKRKYEDLFQQELDALDDEFQTLGLFVQEMQIRTQGFRSQKAA